MKVFTLFLVFAFAIGITNAQVIDPTRSAKRKTESKINKASQGAVDRGLDAIEEGIGSLFKKKNKKKKADEKQQPQNQNNRTKNQGGVNSDDDTDFSEYKGSAFVAGKDVIFFDDFATSNLNDGKGNWWTITKDKKIKPSIVSLNGSQDKWLRIMEEGYYLPNDLGALPNDVTIEFDAYVSNDEISTMNLGFVFQFFGYKNRKEKITKDGVFVFQANSEPAVMIDIHPHPEQKTVNEGTTSIKISHKTGRYPDFLMDDRINGVWKAGEVNHIAIARKGNGLQVFVNGKEYFNQSNVFAPGVTYYPLFQSLQWSGKAGMYITNLRVGANAPNATQDLQNEGIFVTSAIYFDVASSRIKPESWATLNHAAQAIKGTSGTIQITGHTDSDGSDASNLVLSQKRAASVKNALVNEFGIDASRLVTDGMGEAQPVADNSTAAGKAKNRRVEFIKQ